MKERTINGPLLSRRFHLVLVHLAEAARRDLDFLAAQPARAMHSTRTRMKNLRALLLLMKPRIPKPERKAVATLAGALKDAFSGERDAHVIAELRAKFSGLRESPAKRSAATRNIAGDRTAKADASMLIRMVAKLGLNGLTWAEVIRGYLRSYRAGRKAMKACERKPGAKAFHAWRRPVKELFYQSQVLQPLDGMKHRRNAAERLGDRLGKMNDLYLIHGVAKKSRAADSVKQIAKQQRARQPGIFKAAAKLFDGRPREIERALQRCVKFHPTITAQAVRQS